MANRFKRLKYWLPLISASTLVIGMWIGWALKPAPELTPGEQKLHDVLTIIDRNYVEPVDLDSLIERSIPGILGNLDPHSAYLSAEDLVKDKEELGGSFSGIGIHFQMNNDTICVVEVLSGGPAEKVGLMAGDRIVNIDGDDIIAKKLSDTDVFKRLRGDKGTKVAVQVVRRGVKKPLKFEITRGDIPVTTIDAQYMQTPETGYVKVNKFGQNTYAEFLQALNSLRNSGAKQFIIDLRGNTGGYMEPAILMVNEFLSRGQIIVSTRGRDVSANNTVLSDGKGAFADFPITVLIDEMSASASEIFSGAIQDNDRGLVIGRRSFGKGLVQQSIKLGDDSEVRLTVQHYYTPSGRCIQKEYKPGDNQDYEYEIVNRYYRGEMTNADSVKINKDLIYKTSTGRTVYGGGGIVPDIFVPNDTTCITQYYINVMNNGLINKFAYKFADANRDTLKKAKNVKSLMSLLPSDEALLGEFVQYAADNGVAKRWYYINSSAPLIVSQLKALIGRDILGVGAYYEVMNNRDTTVRRAVDELKDGGGAFPIKPQPKTDKPSQ
jgi:carboxyl-terminal processing protease